MTYHQLTEGQRYTISQLPKARHRVAEIARILGRPPSTIYGEHQRNTQERSEGRLRRSGRPHHEA